jgi:hypothetical protein
MAKASGMMLKMVMRNTDTAIQIPQYKYRNTNTANKRDVLNYIKIYEKLLLS